ncbi:MAG TPA: heme-binding protein [Pirellulales bacterium]|nr:heme-binding protein [Pirellulales bacterium]
MKRIAALGLLVALFGAALLFVLTSTSNQARAAGKNSKKHPVETGPALEATPLDAIQSLPGFKVERLYSVPAAKQGSWVSMTVDDKGRLITCDQYGSLYRVTPPPIGSTGPIDVEKLEADIGGAQGLLYAFDSLYVVESERVKKPQGLYRLRDTKGNGQFDSVELLRRLNGGGEHGPHSVILGPDGKSLYIVAGNFTRTPDPEKSVVPKIWGEDQLLKRLPDGNGFAANLLAPGGWVCRTDPDGKTWELTAIGMRNCYGIAFNTFGDLFTYDNDMEWDVGLPWYRPTRVCHLTSGSDSGWRNGSGKFPSYYPDNLPAAVNIGLGAPTAVAFGYGTKFPAKYQQALYILDWTYGVIYAVHLEPNGSSYRGTAERFVSGQPLPVTNLAVGHDGALYFTIGGRRTQSGLYRVTYTGSESTAPAKPQPNAEAEKARDLRHQLEAFHGHADPNAVAAAWPHLGSTDRFIRWAARTAIEFQPVSDWQDKALAEKDPESLLTAMVALARCGDKTAEPAIVAALNRLDWNSLGHDRRLELLRAYELAFARMGKPDTGIAKSVIDRLDEAFPAHDVDADRELSAVLVYLDAPDAVAKSIALLKTAQSQEEQIWLAYVLRTAETGWTMANRKALFEWFQRAAEFRGGHSFPGYLREMKADAVRHLSADEKTALAEVLKDRPRASAPLMPPRPFVKKYTMAEVLPLIQAGLKHRNFDRGHEMFAAANCFRCHRFQSEGTTVGPDLTGCSGRFNVHDLLESVVEPSKVIADQYRATIFVLADGRTVVGRISNFSGDSIMVAPNLLAPDEQVAIHRHNIESMRASPISPMPTGLLDTLTQDEVLDLMAYLLSNGDRNNGMFH